MIRRGDVVVVDFPFTDRRTSKVRPALVVQNDADNARRRKTVIALIMGNLRMDGDARQPFAGRASMAACSRQFSPCVARNVGVFFVRHMRHMRRMGRKRGA